MPLTALLALTVLPQLELTWKHAYLESVWRLELAGPPAAPFALFPSLQEGPTRLPLLGPFTLEVGVDQPGFWTLGFLDAGGQATLDFPLPVNQNLVGLPLRAQGFTFPGQAGLIELLSPAVEVQVGGLGQSHLAADALASQRRYHSATQLADGRVLIVGGEAQGAWPLTLELYDPQSNRFSASQAQLGVGRAHHTATLLTDGRVLIAGGVRDDGQALPTALLYNPNLDSLSPPLPMGSARVGHSATRLSDGRVLIVGGSTAFSLGHPLGWPAVGQNLAPVQGLAFDPANNTFSATAALPRPRLWHRAVLLGNGDLLLVGGVELRPSGLLTSTDCRRYDAAQDQWSVSSPLPNPRALFGLVGTADGGALLISGGTLSPNQTQFNGTNQCLHIDAGPGSAWASIAPSNNIVIDGEEICLPRMPVPKIPQIPGGTLGDIFQTGPIVVYFAGGGLQSVNLQTGAAVLNTQYLALEPSYSQWKSVGAALIARPGESFTCLGGTTRALRIGAAPGAGADPGAEFSVLNWWLP